LKTVGTLPEAGFFEKIVRQLLDVTDWMENAAAHGCKSSGVKLELYYNEMMYTNNLIWVSGKSNNMVVNTLDNPNYLVCNDERLIRHVANWFDRIRLKSVGISVEGEKERILYFNELRRRIRGVETE
jgi:hypothetical protein